MQLSSIALKKSTIAVSAFVLGMIAASSINAGFGFLSSRDDFVVRDPWDRNLNKQILGMWLLDDLRTPEVDYAAVEFGPDGKYADTMNKQSEMRWFTNNGVIYFAVDGKNGLQEDGKDYVFSVVPDFSDSRDSFTIAFENAEPHARLIKSKNG